MGNCFLYKRGMGSAGASEVVYTAMGKLLTFKATDKPLKGLRIFGKTTQNGTPTPDAPVPLESVSDGGSVGLTVYGKNLLPNTATSQTKYDVTFTVNDDGSVTVNGTNPNSTSFTYSLSTITLPAGEYILSGTPTGFVTTARLTHADGHFSYRGDTGNGVTLTITDDVQEIWVYIDTKANVSYANAIFYPMIRLASITDDTYKPYKGQTLAVSTPNGLHGIPVTSGGNYTDSTGQQWVCDEVDFARGKYVQRVSTDIGEPTRVIAISDGRFGEEIGLSGYRIHFNLKNLADLNQRYHSLSSAFVWNGNWIYLNTFSISQIGAELMFQVSEDFGITTIDEAKAWIAENNAVFLYPLATPIETALTAEQLAAYAALHTNYPNTTIFNDAGAWMEVKYL